MEVCPVEPPGRAQRFAEAPLLRMKPLVESIHEAITPLLDRPFALFGHSLGGMVAFELARHLRRRGFHPRHLVISGTARRAKARPRMFDLPDDAFLERLREYGGAPAEVLADRELMELVLPCVRADFEIAETHTYTKEPPFDCPVTAFGGDQDREVSLESLEAWAEETSSRFEVRVFPGDHFYLRTSEASLLEALADSLSR